MNLRGLAFEDVKSSSELHDGVTVLVVEGTIVNLTRRSSMCRGCALRCAIAAGHEVYAWTAPPPKADRRTGKGRPFRARLASPPADGRDVSCASSTGAMSPPAPES